VAVAIALVVTIAVGQSGHSVAVPPVAPAPRIDAAGPVLGGFGTSAKIPTAAGLSAALATALADHRLGSHVTVAVRDLATGQLLYSKGAVSPTVPASSIKLATATALLALRGPNYRITTRVVVGAKRGQVVLIGAGDPTLAAGRTPTYPEAGRLDVLADEVRRALGAVKPTQVIVDTSLFSGSPIGPGWQATDVNSMYVHPIIPLTTDGGRIDPNEVGNSERYPNSAVAAGQIFARYLGLPARAVVSGRAPKTPTASATTAAATTPGTQLGAVQSPPLIRILDTMLQQSDNVLAEFMARQVAIASHAPATFAGGSSAVFAVLRKLGLPMSGVNIVDGSGVSHLNRLTPALLTALLSYDAAPDHPQFHAIFSGLPIAGWSGTLAYRYTTSPDKVAAGVLRAKTGTLDGVSALAGTVVDSSGRTLAFAIMADKIPFGANAPAAEDAIGSALYRCGCGG
jgi:serine-type D-Ala-D-Ala carboxypeptidase/endopeptidase (penicillin-binding protein 4)